MTALKGYVMHQHGYRFIKNMRLLTAGLLLTITLCWAPKASAQMFSVKSVSRRYTPPTASAYFSIIPTDFHYKPSGNGTNPKPGEFNFNNPLYRLGIDFSGLELMGTAGWNLGPQNNLNYFGLEVGFNSRYPVFRSKPIMISLPLDIRINYTKVNNKHSADITNDFRQNTGTIGSGWRLDFMFPHHIRLNLEGTANYGFSTRSLGQSSGSAWVFENRDRLYFDRLFGQIGIVTGFDYRFTHFNGDGLQFDYGQQNVGFIVGITF